MASRSGPRSATDATRFTSTTPHASAKTPPAPPRAATAGSRPSPGRGPETPEERVRRLRAAHLAAQRAHVSRFDRFLGGSRTLLDNLHGLAIRGLIGFTVIAGVVTVYSVIDMARYNRRRGREFQEAMAKISQGDQLTAARVALLNGSATPEQTTLVEEATRMAKEKGFKLPPLLPPSNPTTDAATTQAQTQTQPTFKVPVVKAELPPPQPQTTAEAKPKRSWKEWWFSSLKREEEGDAPGANRLGWESLSEEDDATGVRDSDLVRAAEEKAEYIKLKAQAAFERERQNQRRGGALDQVGLEETKGGEKPKKGWW